MYFRFAVCIIDSWSEIAPLHEDGGIGGREWGNCDKT